MQDDRLLRIGDVAEILNTSPRVARKYLKEAGLEPLFLGKGRSRGLRWLRSAVLNLVTNRFVEAQINFKESKKSKNKQKKQITSGFSFAGLTPSDIFALTQEHALQ